MDDGGPAPAGPCSAWALTAADLHLRRDPLLLAAERSASSAVELVVSS